MNIESVKKRYLKKVYKTDSCWIWQGSFNSHGYGNFTLNKKYVGAHKGSYILFIGNVPNGMCVLHKCDNSKCVNPEHLFLGTKRDNAQDAIKKNRFSFNLRERILTPKQVLKIKEILFLDKLTQRQIANNYNVSRQTISAIHTGKIWRGVF